MQGCNTSGVSRDLPYSEDRFGREMRQRLYGEGKKLHPSWQFILLWKKLMTMSWVLFFFVVVGHIILRNQYGAYLLCVYSYNKIIETALLIKSRDVILTVLEARQVQGQGPFCGIIFPRWKAEGRRPWESRGWTHPFLRNPPPQYWPWSLQEDRALLTSITS